MKDPAPQGAATVGYVAAPGLLLAVPVLAGGDGVDRTALSFLVRRAVEDRKREEEEKEKEKARKLKEDSAPRRQEGDGAALRKSLFGIFVQAEEEEEEEEADASYLLSSWPRSSSTPAVRRDLRRQLLLLQVQVEWQGSQRAVGGVSVL